MSQQQIYEVTAPDGTVLEVTGPAGASHEEVIRQAQALYKPGTPTVSAPPPTPAMTGYDQQQRDQTPWQKFKQQSRENAIHILDPFTLPNVASGLGEMAKGFVIDPLTGKGAKRGVEMLKGMAKGVAAPIQEMGEAYQEGDWQKAAGASGGFLSQTLPAIAGLSGATNALRNVAARQAPKIYQKALQPSPRTFSAKEIDAMVQTGLENKLPVTRNGLNKLDGLVNKLNSSIEADIATNPTAPLSPTAITQRLPAARAKARAQVNPEADIRAIDAAEIEFLRQHRKPATASTESSPSGLLDQYGNPIMTPGRAGVPAKDIPILAKRGQSIKKGTYQQINSKQYGEIGSGSIEAQKQLARGIKEELETYFPEIKAKNAAEGKLFDLRPELEAAVNRLGNRRISLANVVNVMADPAVMSRIGIALNKRGVPPSAVALRIRKHSFAISAVNAASASKK